MTIIAIIILVCGIFGGWANFHRYETNTTFKWFNFRKSLLVGVVSSATVPLFLNMVSSDLLQEVVAKAPVSGFVFAGFCLVAAFFSNRFMDSVGDKVIRELEEVKQKTEEMKKETEENKEKVNELIDEKTDDGEKSAEIPVIDVQLVNQDFVQSPLITTLANSKHKFRTIPNLVQESGLDENEVNTLLSNLQKNNMIKQFKNNKGKPLYTITRKGKVILGK